MFNIISIHYLLQFLIFIYIIPIYITIESLVHYFFFNGTNVIRCPNGKVEVYQLKKDTETSFPLILDCKTGKDLYHPTYVGYVWKRLEITCSRGDDQVHEEQFIKENFYGDDDDTKQFPNVESKLGRSQKPYHLEVVSTAEDHTVLIKSNDQPAADTYYDKNINPKERRIYIWFPGHPIICRIIFTGEKDNPCENKRQVEDVKYACYYNPGAEKEPTVKEMEAEFEQIEKLDNKPNSAVYLLDLERPEISPDDPFNPSNNSSDPKQNDNNQVILPNNSKLAKNSSVPKIIGIILGILLLIALIGCIGFFVIRRNRLNNSSTPLSSTNIEKGNKKYSLSVVINESNQSLADDTNSEISKNEPSKEEKPNIELQKTNANRRRGAGAVMTFNDDI